MAKGNSRAAVFAAGMVAAATLSGAGSAEAASLVEITGFGTNPSNLRMHVYAPDRLASPPPVLVAVHYCTGTGPAFFQNTEFRTLADQYGFIVIYPSATRSGQCFDVSSPQALRRGGGSDPVGIMSMVTYVLQTYGANASRVYVTGASSGAMMTNVLVGNYPDVFKAGAAFMGVPHSCFATTDGSMWNSQCSSGQRIMTAQQWGDLARAANPGYSGARPRMQLWHGTNDTTLQYPNFGEEIKQWTNVHGLSQTPSLTDSPQSGWTRTRYGGTGINAPVEGVSIANTGHNLPLAGQARMAIQFFGLDTGGGTDTQAPTAPANLASPSSTSSSISLSWSPSTDNVGVTGYQILRAPGTSGGTFTQVGTSTTTSFTNTGLTASTTFRYQVRANDAAGNVSAVSNTVTAATQAGGGDITPPTAPANLTTTATTSTSISLSWSPSTDNVGVTGYQVLRAPGTTGGTFTQVGTSATTSFTNTGLTASTTYRYQVRATDAAGSVSAVSNTVTAATQAGGGTGGGCSATATLQTQWPTGYVFEPVRVTNTGTATINGWTVTFTLPAGHTIAGSWNAALTVSGQTVTARNAGHNGTVAPSGSTTFGFQVNRPNGNTQLASGYTCTSP